MRFLFALLTTALVVALGCHRSVSRGLSSYDTGTTAPRAVAQGSWERLCTQLTPDPTRSAVRAVAADVATSSLSEADSKALEHVGRDAMPSIVDIHTTPMPGGATVKHSKSPLAASDRSTGSGVVIAADGLILTSEHVLRNAIGVYVVLADGSRHRVTNRVTHPQLDLALLRIDRRNLRPLELSDSRVRAGAPVVAVAGSSFDDGCPARAGVVTGAAVSLQNELDPRRTRLYDELIESTTRIEPGFSGGALLDLDGRLIGLNVAVAGETRGDNCRGYAIPFTADIRKAMAELTSQIQAP